MAKIWGARKPKILYRIAKILGARKPKSLYRIANIWGGGGQDNQRGSTEWPKSVEQDNQRISTG